MMAVLEFPGIHEERAEFIFRAKARRLRAMREFAEQEIIIPDGPHAGERFRCATQPYSGLFFDEVDSGLWNRFVSLGPTQSGKTLCCFCIPTMYHLFEIGENVICGLPDMDMGGDKWTIDIKPVIERTQYAKYLPTRGEGSRDGGKVGSIRFKNGATLKFMSGGGGDKSRAGFTSRVVVITETDGMDESGGASREADKITQLEGRTRAYGDRKRVYMECTVSIESGRTWSEYKGGSETRIVLPCPSCREWVTPEREQLTGWDGAKDEIAAASGSVFGCPSCGAPWTEKERLEANRGGRLIHRGQEIGKSGKITGELPRTRTLGYRWSAVNNMFQSAGDVGADEWKASHSADEDNAEKEMLQFVWTLPYEPDITEFTPLDSRVLAKRSEAFTRGVIPEDTTQFVIGIDVGKWYCNWAGFCWRECKRGIVPEYGIFDVPSNHMDEDIAILKSLHEFAGIVDGGWGKSDTGEVITPVEGWVDSGYKPGVVYQFCRERARMRKSGEAGPTVWRATKGWGAVTKVGRGKHYTHPKKPGLPTDPEGVRLIGERYHFRHQIKDRTKNLVVHLDVDHWKSWIQTRFTTKQGEAGAVSLFETKGGYREHMEFTTALASEVKVQEHVAGKGPVIRWEVRAKGKNHYLDAVTLASAAAHYAGARLLKEAAVGPKAAARPFIQMPTGAVPIRVGR